MTDLVKLAAVRELVQAGAIKGAEIIGLPGGWALQLQTHARPKLLATKEGEARRFPTFEGVLKILRELGLRTDGLRVDAAHWSSTGESNTQRRRPDRSAALKLLAEDAAYVEFLRAAVDEARADPRPALSAEAAEREMAALRASLHDELISTLRGNVAAP